MLVNSAGCNEDAAVCALLSAPDISSLKRTAHNHTKGFSLLLTGVEKRFVEHRGLPRGGDTHQVSSLTPIEKQLPTCST